MPITVMLTEYMVSGYLVNQDMPGNVTQMFTRMKVPHQALS